MRFGIDYSMTSPAACGYSDRRVVFWYAHESKHSLDSPVVHGDPLRHFDGDDSVARRAARLAASFLKWFALQPQPGFSADRSPILIEDYAFNATGRVFHIGENCGILKYRLDECSIPYECVPPTVIKKFATGKGNADKYRMTAAFLEAYPDARAWISQLFPRTKSQDGDIPAKSPLADMADAYWIARYNYTKS